LQQSGKPVLAACLCPTLMQKPRQVLAASVLLLPPLSTIRLSSPFTLLSAGICNPGAFPKRLVPHPPPSLRALKFLPGNFPGAWLRQWHPRVLNSKSDTACKRTGVGFPLLRGSSPPHLPPFRRACRTLFHPSCQSCYPLHGIPGGGAKESKAGRTTTAWQPGHPPRGEAGSQQGLQALR